MTDSSYVVWGRAGWGSIPVEATLTLLGWPYEVREGPDPANPMAQVPTLVLPSGEAMTESAAILIWLADSQPQSRLSPAADDAERPGFLRWMVFISAAIYTHFWIRDDPARVTADAAAQVEVKRRLAERIGECWRIMDAQVQPRPFLTGETLSVLDVYATVVSRWAPGRQAFFAAAPKMAPMVRRVDADPRLAELWAKRFPFRDGER